MKLLTFVLFVFINTIFAEDVRFNTPEETFEHYLQGLKEGNVEKVFESYYKLKHFYLDAPENIESYRILEKKTLDNNSKEIQIGAKLIDGGKFLPGDISLEVLIKTRQVGCECGYYYFRKLKNGWKMISHHIYGSP